MYQLNEMLPWMKVVEGEAKRKRHEVLFAGCGWADQGPGGKDDIRALPLADWLSVDPINEHRSQKEETGCEGEEAC